MSETTTVSTGGAGLGRRLRRTLVTVAREAAAAFERTPVEVILGASAAVAFSVATEWRMMELWTRGLVTVAIALPLVFACSVLHARGLIPAWLRWAATVLVVAGGAAYGYFVLDPDLQADGWRTMLLVGASLAALFCTPLLGAARPPRRERVNRFLVRLVLRSVVVVVYAGALWAGLALALAAVNGLFDLKLPGKAYAHLFSALFILMPPWAVAAGLPALVAPIEAWRKEELLFFRRAGAFLLAPLSLVYLAIVYAYTVRVLATGEVPKNLVSPVVIGAGLLIVATTIALEPTQDDENAAGLAWLIRMLAPLLLPLVLFAIWAVSTRVGQYGWTEFRYLRLLTLLLLAAYAAAALYRLLRRRRPPLASVPAVLAIVLLLAALGPWSATAVARRSQTHALRELLVRVGRTHGGGPALAVASETFREITGKADYLDSHFGWGTLRQVAPWIGAEHAENRDREIYAQRLGIVERLGSGGSRWVTANLEVGAGVPGIESGTLYTFDIERGVPSPLPVPGKAGANPPKGASVNLDSIGGRLLVVSATGTSVADLVPLMRALLESSAGQNGSAIYRTPPRGATPVETGRSFGVTLPPSWAVHPLRRADGGKAGQVVLRQIQLESTPAKAAAPGAQPASAAVATRGAAVTAPPPAGHVLRLRGAEGFLVLAPAPDGRAAGAH